jgi:hypothetical protein
MLFITPCFPTLQRTAEPNEFLHRLAGEHAGAYLGKGYPVVHSLSVTLSNHTILSTPPYNYPCPKDHP